VTKKQIRKLVLAVVLLLALGLLAGYFTYYRATKQLSFNIAANTPGVVQPPQFLYSFSAAGQLRLQRPIGILADNGTVYVTDSVRHTIFAFDESGTFKGSFGTSQTTVPLYMAKNPKDGNLYVTDRGGRKVVKFSTSGKYLGVFDPKFPKDQLPKFKTNGVKWEPVAIAFANDGTMYVTEILNGHRLVIFGPDGTFERSVGTAGIVTKPDQGKLYFQFPNGLMVAGNNVYVADSNNRRVQVFDHDGNFQKILVTQGLPRGIALLDRFPGDTTKTPDRFVEVDTLAHDATIWTVTGQKVLSFGAQGVLDGQFSYPDAVSKGTTNKMFITDTANGRVQVWGWPAQVAAIPAVINPNNAWVCLLPLLLLPLLLLNRKRRFVATPDFVTGMISASTADLMPQRRRKWIATPAEYEQIEPLTFGEIDMGKLFESTEFSDSDARALAEKLEIDMATAATLSLAKRAKTFCTQSPELRRLAKLLELDVLDCQEFAERFASKKSKAPEAA
jgi:sugar lactone lactonase YvrE